jgi:membrane protein
MIARPFRAPLSARAALAFAADLFGFLRFVYRRWTEDRIPQIAGSLTYTTMLALVPIFVIAVAVLSSAPFFEDVMAQIKIFLLMNLMPEIAGKIITVYMEDFSANARRLTFVGLVAVFVVAVLLMLIVDRSLNVIWRVRRSRPYWLSVLGYVLLLVIGPVLIGLSVSITTFLMSFSYGTSTLPAEWHPRLLRIVPTIMSAIAFFVMYRVIPHRHVPWKHALLGGVVAAVLFETAKQIFGVYVRYAPTYSLVYGAFAAVPIFLIWVYISWLVILLGAELAASASYWHAGLWKKSTSPSTHFRHGVNVARSLLEAGQEAVKFEALRRGSRMPVHELEDTLSRMMEGGIVKRRRGWGYMLARDPAEITLEQLYEATVAPVGGMTPDEWNEIAPEYARAAREMRAGLERPLTSLKEGAAAKEPATPKKTTAPVRKAGRGRARSGKSSR